MHSITPMQIVLVSNNDFFSKVGGLSPWNAKICLTVGAMTCNISVVNKNSKIPVSVSCAV